ncbi:MAG TPA: YwmB family TATA-box binding protein [Bacillota bacterium]
MGKWFGLTVLMFIVAVNPFYTKDEMITLATIVEQHKWTIDQWEVTIKEPMAQNELQHVLQQLIASKQTYTMEESNQRMTYTFEQMDEKTSTIETMYIVLPKNESQTGELIAVLTGEAWTEEIVRHYRNRVQLLTKKYFTDSSVKYTCLTTGIDDIINLSYFLENLSKKRLLDDFHTQYDTVEESRYKKIIYAYSPLWDQYFETTNNERMNVQMAIMKDHTEKIKCTIGTPILINEY